MIEQRARYRRLRDRSIFVGDPGDIVPETFGLDLPGIRDWTENEFAFSGYITGFDPAELGDREALRAELGYGADERVCIVTVGGTAVGEALLRRILDAVPTVRQAVPDLSFAVVAGPRIDPASLPHPDGVAIHPYVISSTDTSPCATSRWCRAGSPPAWSSPPTDGRSSTCPSATTSSRTSTSDIDWPTTEQASASPTTSSRRRRSPPRSSRRSIAHHLPPGRHRWSGSSGRHARRLAVATPTAVDAGAELPQSGGRGAPHRPSSGRSPTRCSLKPRPSA
jgi:hypothetical protein